MKYVFPVRLPVAVFFLSILSVQCKKDTSDPFCEVQRATYQSVSHEEGMVVYSSKFNRYGNTLIVI